jgi:hypothetical protein
MGCTKATLRVSGYGQPSFDTGGIGEYCPAPIVWLAPPANEALAGH